MKRVLLAFAAFGLTSAVWFGGGEQYLHSAGSGHFKWALYGIGSPPRSGPEPVIKTHFYDLAIERIEIPVVTWRGAMARIGDTLIVSGRDGELYQVARDGGPAAASMLQFKVPVDLSDKRLAKFERQTLSVLDLQVIYLNDSPRLYASYFDFDAQASCLRINLASIEIGNAPAADGGTLVAAAGDWSVLYRTQPCLKVDMLWPGSLFGGGGRIRRFGNDLLMAVGAIGVDGGKEPAVSQLPDYDYGKVLRLSLDARRREIFTSGHRNPEGLAVLSSGGVVATEHGPRGGDEINLLEANGNYGWPLVTYGTNYDSHVWALNKHNGRHDGFRKPLLAFVPSVGIGQVVEIAGNEQFPDWNGDLLVATLREQSLLRARYEEGRIVYVEPIKIGSRLRDISTMADGTIALLTDTNEVLMVRNAEKKPMAEVPVPLARTATR